MRIRPATNRARSPMANKTPVKSQESKSTSPGPRRRPFSYTRAPRPPAHSFSTSASRVSHRRPWCVWTGLNPPHRSGSNGSLQRQIAQNEIPQWIPQWPQAFTARPVTVPQPLVRDRCCGTAGAPHGLPRWDGAGFNCEGRYSRQGPRAIQQLHQSNQPAPASQPSPPPPHPCSL